MPDSEAGHMSTENSVALRENLFNNSFQHKKIYPLPSFSGHPEEWQTFIEAFESTTRVFQYSNLHNIMRIRNALLRNSTNVAEIIETLQQNYGRPEQLIKSQIEKVRTVMPVSQIR